LNFGAFFALRNLTKVRQNSNFKRNFHSRAETSLPKWEMRIFQANTQNPFEIKLPLKAGHADWPGVEDDISTDTTPF